MGSVKRKIKKMMWRTFKCYPVAYQFEQSDCGPAALLTVVKFWDGNATLGHVRAIAGTDHRGTTLLGLKNAAEALGFKAVGATGALPDLEREAMPCIAHLKGEGDPAHFVVVFEVTRRAVVVGDPAVGVVTMSREAFSKRWVQGIVLLLAPLTTAHLELGEPWYRWVGGALKPHFSWLIHASVLALIYTGLGLTTAWVVRSLVDGWIPEGNQTAVVVVCVLLFVVLALRAAVGWVRQSLLLQLNMRLGSALGGRLFHRLLRLPAVFFEKRRIGDITSRLHDGLKIGELVLRVCGAMFADVVVLIGTGVALAIIAPPLAILAVLVLCCAAVLGAAVRNGLRLRQHDAMAAFGRLESQFVESLAAQEVIRRAGVGPVFAERLSKANEFMQMRLLGLGRFETLAGVGVELIAGATISATLLLGGLAVLRNGMTLGQLLAGYSLIAGVTPVAARILDSVLALQGAQVAANRVADILDTEVENDNEFAGAVCLVDALELRDVTFGWKNNDRVLNRVCLKLERGEVAALTGANGTGKSTIVKILTREYQAKHGNVLLDGNDVNNLPLAAYRNRVAVVAAHVPLLKGTVLENVSLGRAEVSREDVVNVVEQLGVAQMMDRLSHGLDTFVGPSERMLSVGERQVVGILRALCVRPMCLIFDEALAGVDETICRSVLHGVREICATGAVLLISHRYEVLGQADRIFVLERGVVSPREGSLSQDNSRKTGLALPIAEYTV